MELTLKSPCKSCDGTGCYKTPVNGDGVPCWSCRGRGWVSVTIQKPNPKWAKQFAKEQKQG